MWPGAAASGLRLLRQALVDAGPLRRHRDFRLLFGAQLVGMFGSQITAVALPFQVYLLTRSSLAVGLVGLAELMPLLGLAFWGGALADARDRRSMVLVTEVAFLVLAAALCVNALLPRPLLLPLYGVAGLQAGLYALQRPSLDSLLPRLVPKEEMVAASALGMLRGTTALIAGPAIAGVLIAALGLPFTYGVQIGTCALGLALLGRMRAVPPAPDAEPPSLRRILDGLRYAAGRQELMGTYLVDMAAMFFGMPLALFPALATRFGGPAVLGLLYAAPAVGSLFAAGTSGWATRVHRHGLAIGAAAAAWGLAIVGAGLAPNLALLLVLLAAAGGADAVSGIFRTTVWNQTIPDHLRGRLAGIELVSFASGPLLGNVESGIAAALVGVEGAIVSGGILCVLSVLALTAALPRFRSYDARGVTAAGPAPAS